MAATTSTFKIPRDHLVFLLKQLGPRDGVACPKSHSKAVQGGPGIWLLVAFQHLPPHQNPTSLNFLTLSPLTGVTSMSLKSLFLLLGKPFLPVPLPCFPLTPGLL